MALTVPTTSGFEIKYVRKAIRALVQAAAPLASVHAEWKLEFDGENIPRSTNNLKGIGDHSEFVHSWMIGLANETPITTEDGVDRYVGGRTSEYILGFAVWGFFEYKGWRGQFIDGAEIAPDSADPEADEEGNATAFAEKEHRAIKAFVRANPRLDLTTRGIEARPFALDNADVHGFSNGNRILVMQGSLNVKIKESFA